MKTLTKFHYLTRLFFLSILLCSLNLHATSFFIQDFSSDIIPQGWSSEELLDTTVFWSVSNDGVVPLVSPTVHNGFAYIEDKNNASVNSALISPKIDCSDKEKVILTFYSVHLNNYQQSYQIYVSNDSITWTQQYTYSGESGRVILDISDIAAMQAQVRIKWAFESSTSSFWGIDDVSLSEPVTISLLKKIEDINVLYGTPIDNIPFPEYIIAITENGEGLVSLYSPNWTVDEYLQTTPGTYTFQIKSHEILPSDYYLAEDLDSLIEVNVIVDPTILDLQSIETPEPLLFYYGSWWWNEYVPVKYTTSTGVQTIEIIIDDWDKDNSDFNLMKAGTYPVSIDLAPYLPTNVMTGNVSTIVTMDWVIPYKGNIAEIFISEKVKVNKYSSDTSTLFLPEIGYLKLDDNSIVSIDLSGLEWVKNEEESSETSHTYTTEIDSLLDSLYSNTNNISTTVSCCVDYVASQYFTLKMTKYWSNWNSAKLLLFINGEFRGAFAKSNYQNTFYVYAEHKDSISIYFTPDWYSQNYSLEVSSYLQDVIFSRVGLPDNQELLTEFLFLEQGLDHDLKIKVPEQKWSLQGAERPISLCVENEGLLGAYNFSVKLMLLNSAQEVIFSSTKILNNDTLAQGESLIIDMDAVPSSVEANEYDLQCEVNYIADENPFNNESSELFNVVELNYPDDHIYYINNSNKSINSSSLTFSGNSSYVSSTMNFNCGAYIDGGVYLVGQDNFLYIMDGVGNTYYLDSVHGLDYNMLNKIDGVAWNENTNTTYFLADFYYADTLYSYDMETHNLTSVGALKASPGSYSNKYSGLACDKNGVLYTYSDIQLFSVDMSTLETKEELVFPSELSGIDFDTHNDLMVGVLSNNGEFVFANIADSTFVINGSKWGAPFPVMTPVKSTSKLLAFEVKSNENNLPVVNAEISIYPHNALIQTDSSGMATFYTYINELNFSLSVDGYDYYTDDVSIMGDEQIEINLKKTYQVVWIVKDVFDNEIDYLSFYGIRVNKDQYQRYIGFYSSGEYEYRIESYNFGVLEGSFEVNGKDTIIELYIEPEPIINFYNDEVRFYPAVVLGLTKAESQTISMSNRGGEAFFITDIQLLGEDKGQFNIDLTGFLPLPVYPSETIKFTTSYLPDKVGEHSCEVIFTTNVGTTILSTLSGVSYLPYKTPYVEDFESGEISGAYWNAGKNLMSDSLTLTEYGGLLSNNPTHWWINSDDSTYLSLFMVGNFTYDWLISPIIDLEEGGDSMVLEFDFSLETAEIDVGSDDRFMVVVSYDYGKTWLMKDTLILFDNDTVGNIFTNLNDIDTTFSLSLAGISGQIVIGFYGESTVYNTDNFVVIDNIKIYDKEESNSVKSLESPPALVVIPNPAQTYITLVGASSDASYKVLSLAGRTRLCGQVDNGIIDVSSLESGVYFIDVEQDNNRAVERLIIRK